MDSMVPRNALWWVNICASARQNQQNTKWHVRPAKTLISLGIRPVWSESSLSTWRKFGSLAIHWAHSEDSDQAGRMPKLICLRRAHMPFCRFCRALAHMWRYAGNVAITEHRLTKPASVAQLNARSTGEQEVAGSTAAWSVTFFCGDWSWNIFYGHSLPYADSRRVVVSFWRKNVNNTC